MNDEVQDYGELSSESTQKENPTWGKNDMNTLNTADRQDVIWTLMALAKVTPPPSSSVLGALGPLISPGTTELSSQTREYKESMQ